MDSKLISFWSARHRVGTSSLASLASVYLAHNTDKRVLLVDSTAYGDLEQILDFSSKQTLSSLLSLVSINEITQSVIESACVQLESGLFLLPSVDLKAGYIESKKEEFFKLVSVYKEHFDLVIVDLNAGLNSSISTGLLEQSDMIINIIEQDKLVIASCCNSGILSYSCPCVTVINKFSEEIFPTASDIVKDLNINEVITFPYNDELRVAYNNSNLQKLSIKVPSELQKPLKKLVANFSEDSLPEKQSKWKSIINTLRR